MARSKKLRVRYRRSDNGQYTTKRYAERHPRTTVKETDRRRKR